MALNNLAFNYLLADVFVSISVVFIVILRYMTRRLLENPHGLNDYFIYGAVALLIGMSANGEELWYYLRLYTDSVTGAVMYMHGGADGTLFDDLSDASKEIFYKVCVTVQVL